MTAMILKYIFAGLNQNGNGDLQEICCLKIWNGVIWSLDHNSCLKSWTNDLQLLSTHQLKRSYVISFDCDDDYLYLGTGDGQIIIMNKHLQTIKILTIGQDIISDIKVNAQHLYIISYDGSLTILHKSTHQIMKKLDLGMQLYQICLYKQYIYLSGPKSYRIDTDYTIEEITRANRFVICEGLLYAVSDQFGFYSISESFSTYSPAQILQTYHNYVIGIFDQGITIFDRKDTGCQWTSTFIPQFKSGYAFKSIISLGNDQFIIGNENGRLYKIKVVHQS